MKAGYDRGIFVSVADEDIPLDKKGPLITNGAGAVKKLKEIQGRTVEVQRIISIVCLMNTI